jgi:DNA polymerase-3 subunit gamma/tau
MSLYLKYRPNELTQVKGNSDILPALQKMLENIETCPHTFLLTGPTGCGKTTLGRIIANALGSLGDDFKEIDSADFRGIDTVREIGKQCNFRPIQSKCRVWLIDECHKMTNDAQNAFLKRLEDTPPHVYFILCTTDPEKLIPTIKGRCQQFQVKTLNEQQLHGLLRRIVREENETLEKEVYEQIIQDSLGHPRNAIQILEQVLNSPVEKRLEIAKQTIIEQSQSIELCRALLKGAKWKEISSILNGLINQEPEGIRRHIIGYCQSVLLKSENDRAALILEQFWEPLYNIGFPGLVYCCYSVVKN